MKIPSSSSIIFATLAISSSSSSLAAPTGDTSYSEGAMASSSSNHELVARHDRTTTTPFGRSDQRDNGDDKQPELSARRSDAELEGRGSVPPLCAILGLVPANLVPGLGTVEGLLGCSTSTAASAESVDDDPVTVEQIQSALASVSSSLVSQASNLPVSPPISRPDPPSVPVSAVLGAAPVPTAIQSVLARDVAPGEPSTAPTPPSAPSAPGTAPPSAPPNTPTPPASGPPAPPANAPGVVTGAAGTAADRVPVSPPVGGSGSA